MVFEIEIQYQKGPTFSEKIKAYSEDRAKSLAIKDARDFGFNEKIKKIIIKIGDL